ncbi:hypothetical protein D9611_009237 [Ephemerocybe angulata]|uniref:SCD domain-containing protein n=1 Tax=Ephemerocybe angulata TaxID=980116 RepID=A0A8H5F498_9AGAR|nr:hypothetical protein D9611_009237 [Tulosesus angulatus]
MSATPENTPTARRSQRERKVAKPFVSVQSSSARKRKRPDTDAEDETPGRKEPEEDKADDADGDADVNEDEDEEEEGYESAKPKPARKGKAKAAAPKEKAAPAPRKPREPKAATTRKTAKAPMRRGRKVKEGDDTYDADQVARDTKIGGDNPLFNAIMNPAAALQATTEDFLESLEQSPGPAQAELITLFLRSCGCNDTVSPDDALDYDGVVDNLDNITEALKQDNSPVYPLTSKLPIFKKFRKSLSEFIERLITSAADLGLLYSTDLMATLQTWVVAMSSSQIRSFRHTATVVALEVETSLCEVAAAVEKEAQLVGRQREGEKKRKGTAKGATPREKELQAKAQEIRERRQSLAEYLKEFVDGVFVHRYRDLDPNIRAECVKAIGLWFKKYPGHFLDGAYLRYVGWVLSDSNTSVRLEAVKALSGVYEQADYIGSINHFTERFKPRLLEMATSDTELSVRVAVIQVLGSIDSHALLEEEERETLCLLIYDEEPKVRKAVSQFVRNVWDEAVEERLVTKRKPTDEDRTRAGIKTIASLFVKWSKALDSTGEEDEENDNSDLRADDDVSSTNTGRRTRRKEILSLVGTTENKGRTALAVEALWDEIDTVSDWEELLDILLLDHSSGDDDSGRARTNGKSHSNESNIDDLWRLEEVEETVLLEVLVASLRRVKVEAGASKKAAEDENTLNDTTRALIKALPRLFIKYQADGNRIAEVLTIPSLLNLDLYLEMRMIAAYSSLWDDIIKQFMSHSSVTVLSNAMLAIRCLMDATSLSNTNSTKILELEDELSTALRDAVAGRDEIEVASFTEDEVLSLSAIGTRLSILAGMRNMSAWIDEDEGGKQSSAWDIFSALAERGRLGYKEEETMVEQALNVLTLHIYWKAKGLLVNKEPNSEENPYQDTLVEQRNALLEKLQEYAIGTQSNTGDSVRRAAFKHLLNHHILFSPDQPTLPDGSLSPLAAISISFDDETQYRCAGYIQAEIERYSDFLADNDGSAKSLEEGDKSEDEESNAENADEDENGAGPSKKRKGKKKAAAAAPKPQETETVLSKGDSRALLEREYLFVDVITTFLRAIRVGTIAVQHGAVLLSQYGRLGASFDACAEVIVKMIKDEGLTKDNGELVVNVITKSLQEAFTLALEGLVSDESESLALSKLLSQTFVLRGSQLSILKRLDAQYIVQIHVNLLNWVAKRLKAYESNKNKKLKKTSILFFKLLVPLVNGIDDEHALKIKAHMEQVLADSNIEIPPTSKEWEPQRSYAKRLDNVMNKGKATTSKPKRRGAKATGAASDEEGLSDGEGLTDAERPAGKTKPRPKPRRVTRSNPVVDEAEGEGGDVTDGAGADAEDAGPTTPKARGKKKAVDTTPRSRSHSRASSALTPNEDEDEEGEQEQEQEQEEKEKEKEKSATPSDIDMQFDLQEEQEDEPIFATPKSSAKKRARPDDEEEEVEAEPDVRSPSAEVETTPIAEVRRKRIRH